MYVIVPIPVQTERHASPRARELSAKIEQLIVEFSANYPNTRESDVREALDLLQDRVGTAGRQQRSSVAVLLGALVVGVGVALFVARGDLPGLSGSPFLMMALVALLVVVLGVVVAVRSGR